MVKGYLCSYSPVKDGYSPGRTRGCMEGAKDPGLSLDVTTPWNSHWMAWPFGTPTRRWLSLRFHGSLFGRHKEDHCRIWQGWLQDLIIAQISLIYQSSGSQPINRKEETNSNSLTTFQFRSCYAMYPILSSEASWAPSNPTQTHK